MSQSNGAATETRPGRFSVASLIAKAMPTQRAQEAPPVELDLQDLILLLHMLDQADLNKVKARPLPQIMDVILKLQAQRDRLLAAQEHSDGGQ